MEIKNMIEEVKQKLEDKGGLKNIYFIACGGSMAALYGAYYFIKNEAETLTTNIFTSNEFVQMTPKQIGENTICIICSQKATAETVEAVKLSKRLGATTIALTGGPDTDMAKEGEYVVTYTKWGDGNQAKSLNLAFEILNQFEGYDHYDEAISALDKLEDVVVNAMKKIVPEGIKWSINVKDKELVWVLASGSTYGAGYTFANCHLIEMQWKNALLVHSAEFFHGPFEMTKPENAMVLFKGVGRTRVIDERVERFLDQYCDNFFLIDTKELGIEKLGENVCEYFNSAIMIPVGYELVNRLGNEQGHPITKRRYMWQFDY